MARRSITTTGAADSPSSSATVGPSPQTPSRDLKKFAVPTLILQGDDDQIVPYTDASVLQAKLIKGSTLKIYKGGSHGMCTVNKDEVNEDLYAFKGG
jgi:pimeloyl-ACP methyl ester carboxylesterase